LATSFLLLGSIFLYSTVFFLLFPCGIYYHYYFHEYCRVITNPSMWCTVLGIRYTFFPFRYSLIRYFNVAIRYRYSATFQKFAIRYSLYAIRYTLIAIRYFL
jgi:hypothetical protein